LAPNGDELRLGLCCEKLREIIRSPDCDLGTALCIYWSGRPDFFRQFKSRDDVGPPRDDFDLLVEIEQRVADGFYRHRQISYDPFDDRGTDQTNVYPKLRRKYQCELPEVMYQPVGKNAVTREPRRSGKERLPVGLAAIAAVGKGKKLSAREKAITALNELNDHSAREVVELDGDRVVRIGLGSNYVATDDALKYLKHFPDLVELALGQEMTDAALKHLKRVPDLKILEMGSTKFSDKGLSQLKHLRRLEKLTLHGCKNITDKGMAHVGKLSHLRRLDLASTKIGNEGLAHLTGLTNLEHLDVSWYTKVTNPGLEHIGRLTNLRWLRISKTKIGNAGLHHLESLKKLETLIYGETKVTEKGAAHLKEQLPDCDIRAAVY